MKTKSNVVRMLVCLIFAFLWGGQLSAFAETKAWVKYDGKAKTLTFYYSDKNSFNTDEYGIGEGDWCPFNTGNSNTRYISDSVEKVIFDSSFKSARPTSCSGWFQYFYKLTTIEGLENLNTFKVETMRYMFYGCKALTSLDLSKFDTRNVTTMYGMFQYCESLKTLDLSSFWTMNKTTMTVMFSGCVELETIYAVNTLTVSGSADATQMFRDCYKLRGSIAYNSKYQDGTYAKVEGGYFTDKQYTRPWVTYADGTLTFSYGYKRTLESNEYLLNTDKNKPSWEAQNSNVTKVVFDQSFAYARPTSCYYWFHGCKQLEDKNITGLNYLNTSETKYLRDMFWDCPKLTTLNLSSFNTEKCEDMAGMFRSCSGLTSLDISNFNTDKVTDMIYMFYGCSNIETLDLTNFNTSKVKEMEHMFYKCSKLKTIYASDNFTTSQVTYSINMFTDCTALEGNIKWNANNATDKTYASTDGYLTDKTFIRPWVQYTTNTGMLTFRYSFKKTLNNTTEFALNTGQNSPAWQKYNSNVKKVVFEPDFYKARPTSTWMWFIDCGQLTSENIEGLRYLNTSEVTTLEFMFKECSKLTTLDLSTFNTTNVTSIRRMVSGCRALETLKLPKFNTGKLENMFCTFAECNSLENLDLTGINTENVTTMGYMLTGCSSLVSLDLSNFNTAKVTDMVEMFRNCSNLIFILASDKFVLNSNLNGDNMFNGCTSLAGSIAYDPNCVDKTYAKIQDGYFTDKNYAPRSWAKYADGTLTFLYSYKPTLGENEYSTNSSYYPNWRGQKENVTTVVFDASFKAARPTTCYSWFEDFNNLTTINGIEYLNTSKVTNMSYMFSNCSKLTSLNLSTFNTQNVTTMRSMFQNCKSLESIDVSSFNTQNVTIMGDMFSDCKSLETIDVSSFNTQNVTTMNSMFSNCSSLKTLDLSSFNTQNVTDMNYMFYYCSSLESVDLSSFNTQNVTEMKCMFLSSKYSKMLDLSSFNIKNVTNMEGMFRYSSISSICVSDNFVSDKISDNLEIPSKTIIYSLPNHYATTRVNKLFAKRTIKPYVPINSNAEYGTLCVPIGSTLAESSFSGFDKLYTIKSTNKDKGTITMEEATKIEPGRAYVYHRNLPDDATESIITFVADMEASSAVTAPKNDGSLLKGTFERITAPGGCYILQTDGNFHPVAEDNTTLGVGAYRAYLDLSSIDIDGDYAKNYRMVFEDNQATAIDGISDKTDNLPKTYFDLMGRRISTPKHGGMYIMKGKKVIYGGF